MTKYTEKLSEIFKHMVTLPLLLI